MYKYSFINEYLLKWLSMYISRYANETSTTETSAKETFCTV